MLGVYVSSLLIILSGIWIFCSKREHLLAVLLSLEYMSLGIFMFFMLNLWMSDLFYSLIFITFTACEGALGLSILVVMSRSHGGDFFKTFNIF